MKRCDEDWSLGGGSLEGVGWWSLEGVVVMGGGCSRGGGGGHWGAHNADRGENAKNEEEEDHSEDRGECMDTVLCH